MKSELATTKLSSKGQIVIPEDVRTSLGLKTGDQFIVIGKGDTVILKTITEPSFDQFEELLIEAQKQAKKAGMIKKDVQNAIQRARKKA